MTAGVIERHERAIVIMIHSPNDERLEDGVEMMFCDDRVLGVV